MNFELTWNLALLWFWTRTEPQACEKNIKVENNMSSVKNKDSKSEKRNSKAVNKNSKVENKRTENQRTGTIK